MDTKRYITVNNEKVEIELRVCADHGCNKEFWATAKSKQSICSIACWEYVNHRAWFKCVMPKVRKPGDPKRRKNKKKGRNMRLRSIIDSAWKGHVAKTKSFSKQNAEPQLLPRGAKAH